MSVENRNLSNNEILRYSRQLILPEFGVKGQRSLKDSKALIVGCGGLGCPAAIYLAAAGIGCLGLLDYDDIELTNLHRQILHKESCEDQPKCNSARDACNNLNSYVRYNTHRVALSSSNAKDIIKEYDIILDCTDNVATRYLLNDACVLLGKPLVSGAALKLEGQLTVYNYEGGPCYRCLYPVPPPAHTVTNCSDGGVLGVIPGIIGTMQAQETIKVLCNIPGVLSQRLFLYDGLNFSTRVIKLRPRQESCSICGVSPTITDLIDYIQFCGAQPTDKAHDITIEGINRLSSKQYFDDYVEKDAIHVLLDVRATHELDICSLPNATNIPLSSLVTMSKQDIAAKIPLDLEKNPMPIVCICHHGNDSQLATQHLQTIFSNTEIADVIGGLDSWARCVDKDFPVY